MTGREVIDTETAQLASHGSYCPKMCTFACPVTAATGRDDAVPWGFHRTVSDLATGRLPISPQVAERLTACTGCLACRVPCAFDQDVPAQVRAGRAALHDAGVAPPVVVEAVAHVAAGCAPTGTAPPRAPASDDHATTLVVAGCRDDADTLAVTAQLLRAAGERVAVRVPEGCCGALLDDLGARDAAREARQRLEAFVGASADGGSGPAVVATDPHCLPSLRAAGVGATDLASHLDVAVHEGRLHLGGSSWSATWHDPCVLARAEGVVDPPRRLLTAAGADLTEPEHHGERTSCSGAGLGLDQLDLAAADATAAARAAELGGGTVVTGCARAAERLAAAGVDVTDLATALAPHVLPPATGDGPTEETTP